MRNIFAQSRRTAPPKWNAHGCPSKPRSGKIDWISVEATCLLGFCLLVLVAMLIGVGEPTATARRSTDPSIGVREIVSLSAGRSEVAIRYIDRCLIWNPQTDDASSIWLPASEHHIAALAGSSRAPEIFIGRADGWLTLIDISSQVPLWEGVDIDDAPTHAIFSPDGTTIAVATNAGRLILLDAKTGALRWEFNCGDSPLMTACFSSEGDRIFTVSDGSKLIAVDTRSGQLDEVLSDDITRPSSLAASDDGRTLAIGTFGGRVILWDLIAERECYNAEHSSTAILAVHLDPQSEKLIYSTTSGTIGALSLDGGHRRIWIGDHAEAVPSIVIQDEALITGSFDGEIRTWSRPPAGPFGSGADFTSSQTLAPQTL